ncbi:Indigoidine synthase A like protein-domain-containing protein [Xylariaceae sp. FL1272]|nr:Indigoidine synthase A like protein-domain-containing protein [Xylariaceae sp. FL1272]
MTMQALRQAAGRRLQAGGCRSFVTPKTNRISNRARFSTSGLKDMLRVSEEVTEALATNKPVVALESTIYTHGALGSDLDLEGIVRRNGGVPAVCGILGGVPIVGLTPEEVIRMVEGSPKKVSRRDLAYIVGSGMRGQEINGGTTIAGTMILSRLAGIRVFGTGGLGGVHRGGHISFDISADLTELGRTRVAVVSSGSKGFLDIPRSLEYLETQGVMVSTFADGRVGDVDLPAFWARESGIKSPFVVQDEAHAAAIFLAQEKLNVETGMLFTNPIPQQYSIPRNEMDIVIEQAVRESDEQGAHGWQNTPFILKRIRELTSDRSTTANKYLVQANVERATKVATEISKMMGNQSALDTPAQQWTCKVDVPKNQKLSGTEVTSAVSVVVAGSVAVDLSCDYNGSREHPTPQLNTSNPARVTQSIGGVGRNVALAAHRITKHTKVQLYSMVGDDLAGSTVLASLESCGMDVSRIERLNQDKYPNSRTAQYVSVNDAKKDLVLAMADMDIFTSQSFSPTWASTMRLCNPKWLVVDANWRDRDIRSWMQTGKRYEAHVAFEPVSKEKSTRLFCAEKGLEALGVFPHATVDITTPNQHELAAMHAAAQANEYFDDPRWWDIIDAFAMRGARDRFVKLTSATMTDAGIPQQAVRLLPFVPTIITKMGSDGALLTTILRKDDPRLYNTAHERFILSRCINDHADVGGVYMRLYPSVEQVSNIASVNGVGDTFLGALIAGLAQGGRVENLINVAQKAAVLTLRSPESVSENLAFTMVARQPNLLMGDDQSDIVPSEDDYGSSSDQDEEPATGMKNVREKDEEEEDLERFVLGDAANFRENLFRDDDAEGEAYGEARTFDDEEAAGDEELADADLFTFDVGGSPVDDRQITIGPDAHVSHTAPKEAAAWEDSDDERLTISLANVTQLRKLRVSEAEDVISGTEYISRLRQQYLRLNTMPDWARQAEEPPKKRRRRSSAASDDSDASTSEGGGNGFEPDALPLNTLLRDAGAVDTSRNAKTKKLRPEVIDIQRSRDIPDAHKDVTSLAFHPEYPVLLSSSTSSMLYLHHIAPTAHPKPNPMLTSAQVKQVAVRHAEFTSDGRKIFLAGRRKYIHSWDIETGTIQKTSKIIGHKEEQKTWERFKLSPCGRYLGLIASIRKGGGVVNILNVHTMQWITAARLDSRGGIIDFCWWSTGNGLTILGKGGQVGEYSMAARRFLAVWNDEGSNGGTAIALGGANGPDLLGVDRWIAIGSNSGVVNVYDRHSLILPSEDELELKQRPEPTRALMQLTTPVTTLAFSPDGQLLAIASRFKKDALKLVHLPSCTVYRNWPTEQTPLGRIDAIAFSRKSDMVAIGNDAGKIRMWEIRS